MMVPATPSAGGAVGVPLHLPLPLHLWPTLHLNTDKSPTSATVSFSDTKLLPKHEIIIVINIFLCII